jgi:hypothetical protein
MKSGRRSITSPFHRISFRIDTRPYVSQAFDHRTRESRLLTSQSVCGDRREIPDCEGAATTRVPNKSRGKADRRCTKTSFLLMNCRRHVGTHQVHQRILDTLVRHEDGTAVFPLAGGKR